MEKTLELFATAFSSPGPGAGLVEIEQSFYDDGLFFACRKEIFSFNKQLAKTTYEFYTYLLAAEKARKVDKSNQLFKTANEAMKEAIKDAYKLMPGLKELLQKQMSQLERYR